MWVQVGICALCLENEGWGERSISVATGIDNHFLKLNPGPLLLSNRTRHISILNASQAPFRQFRVSPHIDETDYNNDVSQWNMEAIMETYFRENKDSSTTQQHEEGNKRRKSECAPNREMRDFLFPPSFSKRDREH